MQYTVKVISHQHRTMQNVTATTIVNRCTGAQSIVALPVLGYADEMAFCRSQHPKHRPGIEVAECDNVAALPGYEAALIMAQCQGVWELAKSRCCPSMNDLISMRAKALRREN